MAFEIGEYEVFRGPSWANLMLAVFDTQLGVRPVEFGIVRALERGLPDEVVVHLDCAKRLNSEADEWLLTGTLTDQPSSQPVSILYFSRTQYGRMTVTENQEAFDFARAVRSSRKERALMILIQKMAARYQNQHRGNLDEDMFKLFEIAKSVHLAEGSPSLSRAIASI